jgi:TRAP-type C4-dicarboxylate transport system permease small subunit
MKNHTFSSRIEKANGKTQTLLGIIAGFIIIALMILTVADAIGRYAFLKPITGAHEIGQLMMAGLTYLAIGYALMKGAHIRITFFVDKLNLSAKYFVGLIGTIIGLSFFVIHSYGSWQVFWQSFAIRETMYAAIALPWWLGKLLVFVGAVFMCIQFFVNLILRKV